MTRLPPLPVWTAFLMVVLMAAAPAWGDSRHEELIAQGERALLQGNAIVAERAFAQGMDAFPDDPRFPLYAGIASYMLGRPQEAERRLEQARESFPRAEFMLGLIALEQERPEQALSFLEAFLERQPRDPDGLLLKGLAQLALEDPTAVDSFNLAANLDRGLISHALFYRGLSQYQSAEQAGADKALRAVLRLGEQPRLLDLAEQTLDLMADRGEAAKRTWTEAYVDVIYDENINRELDRRTRIHGMRTLFRGRFWMDVLEEKPRITAGGWVEHDQPFADGTTARTGIGLLADGGFYKSLETISIDPGLELEPSLIMGDVGGGYGLDAFDIAIRPRVYLFADHERSTKLFYELGYRSDLDEGFHSGLRQRIGIRPSWTGRERRTYVSALIAYENVKADAAAFDHFGARFSLDGQVRVVDGLLLEAKGLYRKAFYREIQPSRDEDVVLGHFGIGWWGQKHGILGMLGVDQELHLSSEPNRDWNVRSYWLRLGAYL